MTTAQEIRPLAIYAITRQGIEIAVRLKAVMPAADVYVSQKLTADAPAELRGRCRCPWGPRWPRRSRPMPAMCS